MLLKKRTEIDAFIAKPPEPIIACLIYGADRGQVIERSQILAKRIVPDPNDPFNTALLTDSDIDSDPAKLEDELCAQSLMGGRRLVRLKLFSEKSDLDKVAASALSEHAALRYNPDAFFLIEAGNLAKGSALLKLCSDLKNTMTLVCYEDETGDIVRMARETLALNEVALTPDAMDIFARRLPKERGVARQEIERLCLFIGPGSRKTLNDEQIQDFFGVEPEASLFQAALDAFGGRMKPVQDCLRRAFAEGETGTDAVRALSGHLAKLRLVQAHLANGAGTKEATKAAGVFWKQENEFLRQAKTWSAERLEPISGELIDTDIQCKSTGMPHLLLAERLFMTLSARAKRYGL